MDFFFNLGSYLSLHRLGKFHLLILPLSKSVLLDFPFTTFRCTLSEVRKDLFLQMPLSLSQRLACTLPLSCSFCYPRAEQALLRRTTPADSQTCFLWTKPVTLKADTGQVDEACGPRAHVGHASFRLLSFPQGKKRKCESI